MHRFDTIHECDRQTDRRPDDGKDARSILLSRVKKLSESGQSVSDVVVGSTLGSFSLVGRSPTASTSAQVEELVDEVPDKLEDLCGSDEGRTDPQTQLTADVTDQRRNLVLRTLARHQHLTASNARPTSIYMYLYKL